MRSSVTTWAASSSGSSSPLRLMAFFSRFSCCCAVACAMASNWLAVRQAGLRPCGFESWKHAQLDLLARVVVEFLRLVHRALPHRQIVVIRHQIPIEVQNV